MTLGEKITRLRKENNYTQEQLAEILGVSRQSVSKWESDMAYPETDKLIKLGKFFNCSMDYLLKEDCNDRSGKPSADGNSFIQEISAFIRKQLPERKSEKTVWGIPLYHLGRDAKGFFAVGLNAKGVIAIGLKAKGILSMGLLSVGVVSIGLLSLGLTALGVFSLGLLSVGSIAAGLFATGAISFGILSFGALAIGKFSAGALAIGKYIAVGDQARAMLAIGDTQAAGSIYQHIGSTSSADLAFVREWLNGNVPGYFAWAKKIFLLFLG